MCKVDCVQIPVPDVEAGLAFYRDQLGHALLWRTPTAAGLRLPGCDAELVLQTERSEMEPNLLVESADDAARIVAAAGGSVAFPPFDIPIGRCAVVADPWGNRLVLLDARNGRLVTDGDGTGSGAAGGPASGAQPDALQATVYGLISLRDSADGITPEQLDGFFAGWRRHVSPSEHLRILRGSAAVVIAVDAERGGRVVGFVTALSDGVLSAHITLLEVLPDHRGHGIGRAMVKRLLTRLCGLYAVDAVCDPELLPFYESCGMTPTVAAVRRQY